MNPELKNAVEILNRGGLVAFPTETVYGLGADAKNHGAVSKVFEVKERPQSHPVIVHISGIHAIEEWARAIPSQAYILAERFWPGPLTLVMKRAASVLDIVTGGQDTVALRVPAHHVAQALLVAFGGGLVAPSANRYGRISPTTAQHVYQEFGDRVDLVLDGGSCAVGIESTIVDLSGGRPRLLRPGWVSANQISLVLNQELELANENSPRVPGSSPSHYAPITPLCLINSQQLLEFVSQKTGGKKTAVLACMAKPEGVEQLIWKVAPLSPASYARTLYNNLRELDSMNCNEILVEMPPKGEEWEAIHDRLQRAAHQHNSQETKS